jgi:hypothetical protein
VQGTYKENAKHASRRYLSGIPDNPDHPEIPETKVVHMAVEISYYSYLRLKNTYRKLAIFDIII